MDAQQKGIVNTCFLTTRLPSWAGSRQNVTGSDLEGRPVASDLSKAGTRDHSPLPAAEDPAAVVNALIDELKDQVVAMRNSVAAIQAEVNALKAAQPPAP